MTAFPVFRFILFWLLVPTIPAFLAHFELYVLLTAYMCVWSCFGLIVAIIIHANHAAPMKDARDDS